MLVNSFCPILEYFKALISFRKWNNLTDLINWFSVQSFKISSCKYTRVHVHVHSYCFSEASYIHLIRVGAQKEGCLAETIEHRWLIAHTILLSNIFNVGAQYSFIYHVLLGCPGFSRRKIFRTSLYPRVTKCSYFGFSGSFSRIKVS